MNQDAIEQAAQQLVDARVSGVVLAELDARWAPCKAAEAHAIQDATVDLLRDRVAGWKVATSPAGELVRGVVLASRVFDSHARISAALVPMRAVEVEIAFRFKRDLPPRDEPYEYDEVADAVTPFAAIEIVDSRFASYADAPWMHRAADCMSNGAFIAGEARPDWRSTGIDLSTLEATLTVGDDVLVRRVGGHPARDPLLPAVALVNAFRAQAGVLEGQFVTTGTFTGMNRIDTDASVVGRFKDFAEVSFAFVGAPQIAASS